MFGSCRILDLTDEKGFLAGRILADLGADVIKVEKPGGDPSRNIGPFYHDIADPEKSLYWLAFNTNKRGITLNLECASGREIFRRLTKKTDVVIESFSGELNKPGPCLGEDTEYVCTKLLSIPDELFVELLLEGVFE